MYLNDDQIELYEKFKTLHPKFLVSNSTFCRLRPLWTMKAKVSERDTCLCSKHENMTERIRAVHRGKILEENTSSKLISLLTYEPRTEDCLE